MRLILVDPNRALCDAWRQHFRLGTGVEVRQGVFQDVKNADALVTAGNSFGLMDGGVDQAVARAFPGIEASVQGAIRDRHAGELNVGAATVIDLAYVEHEGCQSPRLGRYRFVVYAPTMRVPLVIAGTDVVYRAMWAALTALRSFRLADEPRLVVPGLGTGAGRMPPDEVARQMALAWRNFNDVPERPDWRMANDRHHEIAGRACCIA